MSTFADTDMVIEITKAIEPVSHEMGGLVRAVYVLPETDCHDDCAYDMESCRPGSGGYHGIASRMITFAVGALGRGGVTFTLHAPIYPETALERWEHESGRSYHPGKEWRPLGPLHFHYAADPGYAFGSEEECPLVGGMCWGDVTHLQADAGVEALLRGGVEGVWAWLAESFLPAAINPEAWA